MWKGVLALAALLTVGAAAPAPPFRSLVAAFDRMATAAAPLPPAQRVARFRAEVAPLLPDFYLPQGRDPARRDAQVAEAIADYPAQRTRILAAAQLVEARRAGAGTRFARFFPDYRPVVPVYLLHSLGEMDGGTRTIGGRTALIFGADMIAHYHDAASIGPLFDHELFHTYHGAFFPDCPQVWCQLWAEGLAVLVAARMNPGADDRALLLTFPRPIRPEVEPRFAAAACAVRERLDSEDAVSALFNGGDALPGWPPRMGYLVGLRVAEAMARDRTPAALAHLPPAEVRGELERTLHALGGCR